MVISRRFRRFVNSACAGFLTVLYLLYPLAFADPVPATPRPGAAGLETVTVEAQKQRELLKQQVSEYVYAITINSKTDSLARWQVPICPLVAGLPLNKGLYVFDRVSQIANDAGIPSAPEGCAPNYLVLMSRQPKELIKSLWKANPRMFNKDRGVGGIRQTIETDAPVRVIYNVCSVPPDLARRFTVADPQCGEIGIPGSKLKYGAVRVIYSAVVVVDLELTKDYEIEALTDYVAMASFAQLRRGFDPGAVPTILRLFNEQADADRPQGLSTWDRAFLVSLYKTNQSSIAQKSQIRLRMVDDLAGQGVGPIQSSHAQQPAGVTQ